MFQSRTPSSASRSAFTLIELLVIIGIIAILAAILFPLFAQARAKGRQTACLSNLKQIGTGLMMYTQDYDKTLPLQYNGGSYLVNDYANPDAPYNWMALTQPYIKNILVYQCPQAIVNTSKNFSPTALSSASYYGNGVVMGRPMAVIPNTANIIWADEGMDVTRNCVLRPYKKGAGYTQWLARSYNSLHFRGGNLLYCDGHARYQLQNEIPASAFGLNSTAVGYVPGTTDGKGAINPPALF